MCKNCKNVPHAFDTSYGEDPLPEQRPADMHDTATVENTTALIASLEQQVAVLTEAVAEKSHYAKGLRRIAENKFDAFREEIRGLRDSFRTARKEYSDAIDLVNLHQSKLARLRAENFRLLIGHSEMYASAVKLNQENTHLQQTIDFLRRPLYQRLATKLSDLLARLAG